MNKSFWTAFQEDDGAWSWGRVMGVPCVLTACFGAIWAVIKSQPHWDGILIMLIGALAAFAMSTFAPSKAIQAWKDKGQPQ